MAEKLKKKKERKTLEGGVLEGWLVTSRSGRGQLWVGCR